VFVDRPEAVKPTSKVFVLVDGALARTFRLKASDDGVHRLKLRLDKGLHRIRVVYSGTKLVAPSKSKNRKARARR
jgi:hypothetical protein